MCNKEKCTHLCECGHLLVAHSDRTQECFYFENDKHILCPCMKFKLKVINAEYQPNETN